jgi:uncharacterized protein (TIGR02231 family)
VEFAPLPSHLEPDSVSAKGSGQAEATLYGVRVIARQLETAQDPKVQILEEKIRKVGREQSVLHNLKQVLAHEREYLASIKAASSQQIGKDLITKSPSAADAAAILAFLDEAWLKMFERDQAADVQLEELAQQLDKLQRELAQLTQGRLRQETAILVDLDVRDGGGAFRLEVTYRVPGASWHPHYEARAATASDEVELVLSGVVRQRTGEDWTDVQLTLSTAKPAIAGTMPQLESWFLRPWEPVYPMRSAKAGQLEIQGMPAAAPPAEEGVFDAAAVADKVEEAKIAYAAIEAQGPAVTFRLPKRETIPADWQPHKAPISSQRFAASFAYETTPKLLTYAFLRAKVTNTTDTLYLAGPVSVFLDGAFVSTASLKQAAPGEAFDLYLGIDERVKVERKPLKERVEVSLLPGLRGKMKSTEYEWLTLIENFTGRTISLSVFDQVPISEREEIVVESVKPVPGDVEKDKEKPGVFHWTLELVPNQKQELTLSYRIRHPVDMQIQ